MVTTEGEAKQVPPQQMSAGQRLAAKKAAKAAQKAAKRGTTPVEVAEVTSRLVQVSDWLGEQRKAIGIAALAVGLVLGGWWLWQLQRGHTHAEATAALGQAYAALHAPVGPAVEGGDESFDTLEARAEEALQRARVVVTQHAGTPAAGWARLAEGRALLELQKPDEARLALEAALAATADDYVRWRALEGLGFAAEALEQPEQARRHYEALRELDGGTYATVARYHLARLDALAGKHDEAKRELAALVSELRARAADDEDGAPTYSHVQEQAELLLQELGGRIEGRSAAGQGGNLPADVLEQLKRLGAQVVTE